MADIPMLLKAAKAIARSLDQSPRHTLPDGARNLLALRHKRQRPAGSVLVTESRKLADEARASGGFPLLIRSTPARYDFGCCWRLPVVFAMPDHGLWCVDIARQIAEGYPQSLVVVWPDKEVSQWV